MHTPFFASVVFFFSPNKRRMTLTASYPLSEFLHKINGGQNNNIDCGMAQHETHRSIADITMHTGKPRYREIRDNEICDVTNLPRLNYQFCWHNFHEKIMVPLLAITSACRVTADIGRVWNRRNKNMKVPYVNVN